MKKSKGELKVIRQRAAIKPRMNFTFKPLKFSLLPEKQKSWWVPTQTKHEVTAADPQTRHFPSIMEKQPRINPGRQFLVLPGCK